MLSVYPVVSTELMTIDDISQPEDIDPAAFEGIPPEWEIKSNELKLHCVDGKPIELGRGGYGVVLYGRFFTQSPLTWNHLHRMP